MRLLRLAILALVLLEGARAQASTPPPPPSSELLNSGSANDVFAAVGRFRGSLTCTGFLIDPSGSDAPDARAWLMTAGHCISLEPYGVIGNQPYTAQVQFNYFIDTPDRRVTVRTRSVGWSTMKGADLALVELDATLGDLRVEGIHPLRLSVVAPEAGRSAFWVGISGSPIPPELQFLRLGRCTLGGRALLVEGRWIWKDEISNNCPDLYAGASGSPLLDTESGEVIGVIGTSTLLNFEQGPDYDCQVNRPCVMLAEGPIMERDTSYAAPVQGISQCFDQANRLDLQRFGCPLDPGFQLTVQSGSNEVRPEVEGRPATWDAELSGSQRYYAYKHFPSGEGDCGALSGYSGPILVAGTPMILDRIGSEDGYYFLCVIAGETPSFDSSWQQPASASVRFKRLDSHPPVVPVDYEIDELTNGYRLVNLTGGEGTSGLGITLFKTGSPSATDCSDPRDYRAQTSIPQVLRTNELPVRTCWRASDKAGNLADPVVFDFGPPVILPSGIRNAASLERGAVAVGSVFRVDTFNLTDTTESSSTPVAMLAGVRLWVLDSAGLTLPALMTHAEALSIEAVIPDAASPGAATLIVQPPRGPSISQPVKIRRVAPGLYFDTATVAPYGYASDSLGNVFPLTSCLNQGGCFATPLPLSSSPDGLDFVLYGTGLRGGSGHVKVRIGTHSVDSVEIRTPPGIAGVDELRFHLPQDFPLRLYQTVLAETPGRASNYRWIYLN